MLAPLPSVNCRITRSWVTELNDRVWGPLKMMAGVVKLPEVALVMLVTTESSVKETRFSLVLLFTTSQV